MAKSRVINTKFWDDHYTSDLDPIEKLLFLYLLTNTSTNIAGVYEIPLKKIANETGIDKDMIQKILDRFDRDNKIFYVEGWVWIKNFIKNQNQRSPKVQKGIEVELEAVPSQIKELVSKKLKGIDTLSHSNSNTNTNSNTNLVREAEPITIKTEAFISSIKEFLKDKPLNQNQAEEIKKFAAYWTEPNKSKTRLRWEMEKTWDLERRIARWMGNKSFSNQKQPKFSNIPSV